MSQVLKLVNRLTSDQKKFAAEVIGTFIVVVFATGSVVIDAKYGGIFGLPFIAFAPFVGIAIGVYLFGKISMAHFNPAVTLGYYITKHITLRQLPKNFATLVLYLSLVTGDLIAFTNNFQGSISDSLIVLVFLKGLLTIYFVKPT